MGHIIHHAIVVTALGEVSAAMVVDKARAIGCSVAAAPPVVNGYRSILVAPDGSKSGWPDSEQGDARRDEVCAWLRSAGYDWVEIEYGGDEEYARITRSQWDDPDGAIDTTGEDVTHVPRLPRAGEVQGGGGRDG